MPLALVLVAVLTVAAVAAAAVGAGRARPRAPRPGDNVSDLRDYGALGVLDLDEWDEPQPTPHRPQDAP